MGFLEQKTQAGNFSYIALKLYVNLVCPTRVTCTYGLDLEYRCACKLTGVHVHTLVGSTDVCVIHVVVHFFFLPVLSITVHDNGKLTMAQGFTAPPGLPLI